MTNSKLVVAAIAALGLTASGAARAYAQDDDTTGTGDGSGDATTTEGNGETTPAPDSNTMTPEAGAEGIAGYPQAVIDRPGVLPKGVLEVTANLPIAYIKILDTSSTGVGLGLAARYGLAPKIDGQIGYAFSLKDFEIKGDLGAGVQYELAQKEKLRVAARVTTGLNLNGVDPSDGSSKVDFDGIGLGVNLQYKLTPKVAIYTPGDQITLGFDDGVKPVAINLPFGVGLQASDKLWAFVDSSIGTIGLSPSGNTLISDITPFDIGALFSPSNKLDVGATLGFLDLQHAGDALTVSLRAALRM
ncbi:MAG TPA: hypothetical protein VHE35_30070 [Kofleriaceae bacterium]|nr:hypothetical protein [Kofleriaceae bacterium]